MNLFSNFRILSPFTPGQHCSIVTHALHAPVQEAHGELTTTSAQKEKKEGKG